MSEEIKRKTMEATVKAVGERRVRFTISTPAADRDNDTIAVEGWQLDAYRRNPVVLFGHDYGSLPIARAVDVGVERGVLVATAEFPPSGLYEFADTCLGMLKAGFLSACSVGFRPLKLVRNEVRGGLDFIEQELLEFSVVPVPANPQALVIARSAGADRAVERWLHGGDADDVLDVSDLSGADRARLRHMPAVTSGLLGDLSARHDSLAHLRDDDEVLELDEDINVSPQELAMLIRDGIRSNVADIIPGLVRSTIDRMRGRVD
jgi:HK97 family phage prohead protease